MHKPREELGSQFLRAPAKSGKQCGKFKCKKVPALERQGRLERREASPQSSQAVAAEIPVKRWCVHNF